METKIQLEDFGIGRGFKIYTLIDTKNGTKIHFLNKEMAENAITEHWEIVTTELVWVE